MGSIIGIPTTRVSDSFIRQRLLSQMQSSQLDLFHVQTQLSTGHRLQIPSEDASAALRIMGLQRLLERKEQLQTNLTTNQSYLGTTDTAIAEISGSLAEVRAVALGVLDTIVSNTQREAAVQQIRQTTQQMLDAGNQQFRGRYLFAGANTAVRPFKVAGSNVVQYCGDEGRISSYADVDLLFDSNLNGSEVFGAISAQVLATVDLNPALTHNTRLADLRGGHGISPGSIAVSDGSSTSIVDISRAETIGDVASMIRANPPGGKTLDVQVTATGLVIQLQGDPGDLLTIREVGGGTTAKELGILTTTGVNVPVVGDDLDPILRSTTRVNDILGVRSSALVRSAASDNDLIFEAGEVGSQLNGIEIVFDDDGSVVNVGEDEVATYDRDTRTLTVTVKAGATRARDVVAAVQAAYDAGDVPITARLDPLDELDGGKGIVGVPPGGGPVGQTDHGSGTRFDQDMGLQIVNGKQTHTISFAGAETIEDVLNILNMSDAGVLAQINEDATGIDVRSRISGADFMIGENGGSTATQLGVRTSTRQTRLEDLNHGFGVETCEGTDFTIALSGTGDPPMEIDVSGLETLGDVLDAINNYIDPNTGLPQTNVEARLALYGNGIELRDTTGAAAGANTLVVQQSTASMAAVQLGLVPAGQESHSVATPAGHAGTTIVSASPRSNLIFTASDPGVHANGLRIVFEDGSPRRVNYDQAAGTLVFGIVAGVTTAEDVVNMLDDSWLSAHFTATLDPADGSPNDGSGPVDATDGTAAPMAGGTPTLTGTDVHPLETEGIFTALLRLQAALETYDVGEARRAIDLLDRQIVSINFSRAELGARQQGLDVMQRRLEDENIDLQAALSEDFDVDLAEAISEFTGKQIAFETALRASASIFQMTLLNYL